MQRTVLSSGRGLLESPRWRNGKLYVSDFVSGCVLVVDSRGRAEKVCDVPGMPSGLGWLPDVRMLVVSMHERRVMVWDGAILDVHADLGDLVVAT